MKLTVSIILPVYNEEEGIATFNDHLFSIINKLKINYKFEVLYVVDRCTDNTLAILKKLSQIHSEIRILALSSRFGHQMSLVAGVDNCIGDVAIMMDCDLEHPPGVIIQLLNIYKNGFDVVHTSRKYNDELPFVKKLLSKLYYKILNKLTGNRFIENTADFRLISRRVINVFKNDIREHNQFLRGLYQWVGFPQTTIHYESGLRCQGQSKYNGKKLINLAVTGILSFSKIPLQIAIYLGLLSSMSSMLYGFFSLISYFLQGKVVSGWASMIIAITFLGGTQLLIFGILGLYIGEVFDEVKNRPLYIIEEDIKNSKKVKSNV